MLITAAVFALAALPALTILRERAQPQPQGSLDVVRESVSRLASTLKHVGLYRDFARLLLCSVFYQAGVAVVIALAAIYAQQVMKFSFQQTILLILLVNITAAIGAFAFGYVQDWLGHKGALALTLLVWIAMTIVASLATTPALFWLAANLAGLAMGSSQSAGRAMTGVFAPADAARRVLWPVDAVGAGCSDHRPADLRCGLVPDRQQLPARHAYHRRLFCYRLAGDCIDRHRARPAGGRSPGDVSVTTQRFRPLQSVRLRSI